MDGQRCMCVGLFLFRQWVVSNSLGPMDWGCLLWKEKWTHAETWKKGEKKCIIFQQNAMFKDVSPTNAPSLRAISRSENQCGNPDILQTTSFRTGKHLDHVSIDETSSNEAQAQLNMSGRIKALSFQLKFSNSLPDRLPRFRCATRHWFYCNSENSFPIMKLLYLPFLLLVCLIQTTSG